VFLSYASQDVEAARRICETLRAAGIEVWLDQSELRGGDAWDRKIRDQIRHCALFIPIISGHGIQVVGQAYEKKDINLWYVKGDPLLANVEGDPRFKAFLRRMNLPD
jgi:hypothetical protein